MNFTDLVQLTKWVKGYWLLYSSEPEISRPPRYEGVISKKQDDKTS